MRRNSTIEALAMMTHIGQEELNSIRTDMTPILSSADRALLSMSALGCKEVEFYEHGYVCQRRA